MPSADDRKRRLRRLEDALIEREDRLVEALMQDYSYRSPGETKNFDITLTIGAIRNARRHVGKWMKKRRRPTPMHLLPASVYVLPQPKGVVGIVSPWNFPIQLSIVPLADAFAAGNRAMVKLSELTPSTASVLTDMLTRHFTGNEVRVVNGGPHEAAAFVSMPFDHIVYTGSTAVGRKVAEAAARNLVPVTLELGGKCPLILGDKGDMDRAVERLVYSKFLNAGQICIAPDYALVPTDKLEPFISAITSKIDAFFGDYNTSPSFSAIINDRHKARIEQLIEASRAAGHRVIQSKSAVATNARKIPPTLIVQPTLDAPVMNEEIFGPVLPILTYESREAAMDIVRHCADPLALYIFSDDSSERDFWLTRVKSGGACVNETLFHCATDTLPFGGVGASGQGAYHGKRGFDELSHMKAVFVQPKLNAMALFNPPHGPFKHFVSEKFRLFV
jgi:acyl-CoA reductase-like NAD-dependent aldehyde dehydrogenase